MPFSMYWPSSPIGNPSLFSASFGDGGNPHLQANRGFATWSAKHQCIVLKIFASNWSWAFWFWSASPTETICHKVDFKSTIYCWTPQLQGEGYSDFFIIRTSELDFKVHSRGSDSGYWLNISNLSQLSILWRKLCLKQHYTGNIIMGKKLTSPPNQGYHFRNRCRDITPFWNFCK